MLNHGKSIVQKSCIASLFSIILLCNPLFALAQAGRQQANKNACVILLHGLGRSSSSMALMGKQIQTHGYQVVNIDYPSQDKSIRELAETAIPSALTHCYKTSPEQVHFITHSMGGILVRYYLAHHQLPRLGHVVMLSPPNHGSEIVDVLRDYAFYRWFNGPAGLELGTGEHSLPNSLGAADYSLGIITGNEYSFFDLWLSSLIPGENDGKVSVESAKLQGMADFIVLPVSHPFIMDSEQVWQQVLYFLAHGVFMYSQESDEYN